MKRLRPSSIDIRKKLDSLALGANYIGIHVRTTDWHILWKAKQVTTANQVAPS